jgi:hypothetical protein
MKRKTLAFVFIITASLFYSCLFAQEKESKPSGKWYQDRLYTGGTIGLMFGNNTLIEASPMIGYDLYPKFSMGLGFTYLYNRYKDPYYQYKYSTTILGFRGFARFLIVEQAFVYSEYETLGLENSYKNHSSEKGKFWIDNIYVGGGYRQSIGEKVYYYFMGLINVSETIYTPYTNPLFRIGVEIRL